MKRVSKAFRINKRLAEHSWGRLSSPLVASLQSLTSDYGLSVGRGDIICLDRHWYITHSGLLRLACRRHCVGIQVEMVRDFCDPTNARWAFRATVFPSVKSEGFAGFGDADPSNVSPLVHGAEMRVAETRAVNRALRKAYGIGICSVEELGTSNGSLESTESRRGALPNPLTGTTAAPGSATACARSFASINSTPTSSKPTPLISAR
jgi:hypothetical protein